MRHLTNTLKTICALSIAFCLSVNADSDITVGPSSDWATVSPDGQKLIFVSNVGGSDDIWISNRDGTDPSILIDWPDSSETHPDWSSTGKRIIFSSNSNAQSMNIWSINVDGTDAQQLTVNSSNNQNPRFSPDAQRIVFTSNRTGKRELWIMASDGSNETAVGLQSIQVNNPDWSPDGLFIVYVGCKLPSGTFIAFSDVNCNLYIIAVNASVTRQLTTGSFDDWNPDWGNNDIVFASNRNGSLGLWVIDPSGINMEQLTNPQATGDLHPRWDTLNDSIVFNRSGIDSSGASDNIWEIDVAKNERRLSFIDTFDTDTTPPVLNIGLSPNIFLDDDEELVDIIASIVVTDDTDPNPQIILLDILFHGEVEEEDEDEHKEKYDDEDEKEELNIVDAEIGTDDRSFQLRAEESELKSGLLYTVTYKAIDAAGNETISSATITAIDDEDEKKGKKKHKGKDRKGKKHK